MMVTLTDFFCGAGGSSTGAVNAGAEVIRAANHWQLAIETHNTNHPNTEHDLCDLQEAHPSRFPRTDIAWFSPECTNHSLAKGRRRKNIHQLDLWGDHGVDPEEERSRATMREVVEFSAYHHYEVVIVENVVDIRYWQHYDSWLQSMVNLGYDHKELYLNAMFFGVPQSRDRIYVVFWKRGNRAPDLDFRPTGWCDHCGTVRYAVQSFKQQTKRWGRYGAKRQYVYVCPNCARAMQPFTRPAADVIDWSIPSALIGDRDKPLREKTVARILDGIRKYVIEPFAVDTTQPGQQGRARAISAPLGAQTSRQAWALALPFLLSYQNGATPARPINEPLYAVTTGHNPPLVTPFFTPYYGASLSASALEPMPTIMSQDKFGLVSPFLASYYTRDDAHSAIDAPMPTVTGDPRFALIAPFIAEMRRTSKTRPVDDPLAGITAGGLHHGLVTPFLSSVNYFDDRSIPLDGVLPTQTTAAKIALVDPFMIILKNSWSPDGSYTLPPRSMTDPLTTVVGSASQHALVTPEMIAQRIASARPEDLIDECGFRMLEPEELKRGMSFPAGYVVLGNKRQRVKQVGNAVACNVAEWIVTQCMESLAG